MDRSLVVAWVVAALILGRWLMEHWLGWLNRRHVLRHAGSVPEPFKDSIDPATYEKSIQYTLARNRFGSRQRAFEALILLPVLFSGFLPWLHGWFVAALGESVWAQALFLMAAGVVLSLPDLPWDWYAQFHLEERFGFNTTRKTTWWVDRVKGLILMLALGFPLVTLILQTMKWGGPRWWIWAWLAVLVFQFALVVLGPSLILPWFNRFTPLPPGSLRDRLLQLAERTQFRAGNIQVMDGSKRSRHSNAFFTGIGRGRKIVLFDTLIEQLSESELEAVLAHEIGHYRKRHVLKGLFVWAAMSLVGFGVIAILLRQEWWSRAFGFEPGQAAPTLLACVLVSGTVLFWISPLLHGWSRRHEYEADAFAARAMRRVDPLIAALRKLNTRNLGNLTPHPWFSRFYYSHPALPEREQALRGLVVE